MTRASALTTPTPQYAEEAQRHAVRGEGEGVTPGLHLVGDRRRKRLDLPYAVSASGRKGFVPEPVEPISDEELANALRFVETARDRLMRSRREES